MLIRGKIVAKDAFAMQCLTTLLNNTDKNHNSLSTTRTDFQTSTRWVMVDTIAHRSMLWSLNVCHSSGPGKYNYFCMIWQNSVKYLRLHSYSNYFVRPYFVIPQVQTVTTRITTRQSIGNVMLPGKIP